MSFLSKLPAFFFGLTYEVSQVAIIRWVYHPELTKDADTISFDQIVPLFLLLVPRLVVVETYFGEQDVTHKITTRPANHDLFPFDSRRLKRICLKISICYCLSNTLLSILLYVPSVTALIVALSLMRAYWLYLLLNAFKNAFEAYSPASKRLVEYQRHKDCQDRGLTDSNVDDEISLREVIISPTSSSCGSFP